MPQTPSRLGKGLDALIPKRLSQPGQTIIEVAIATISANPHQPRHVFLKDALENLAASIKAHGILQPLIVSKSDEGYELIAGERRLQAAKLAGLSEVPVIVRGTDEQNKLELALIENIQRENLNPIEEASAYQRLKDEFKLTLKQIGDKVGKGMPTISNKIRLLALPQIVQDALAEDRIKEGHARAILSLKDAELIELAYGQIIAEQLSVRQVEKLVKNKQIGKRTASKARSGPARSIWPQEQRKLQEHLGTKVEIKGSNKQGKIEISFYSEEELKRILDLF